MRTRTWLVLSISVLCGMLIAAGCTGSGSETDLASEVDEPTTTTSTDKPTTTDDSTPAAPTTSATAAPTTTTEPPPRLVLDPLERGDNGDEVVKLQEYLNEIGFSVGTADGDYGRRTERAVTSFQMVSGLVQTGDLNQPTIDALNGYSYDGLVLEAGADGPKVLATPGALGCRTVRPGFPRRRIRNANGASGLGVGEALRNTDRR